MNTKYSTLGLLALLGLGAFAGCNSDKSAMDDFFPDKQERKSHQISEAQATAGARKDATLQDYHFDGAKLNSLGEAKLDLMIPDEQDDDMTVYVNVPANDITSNRKNAVSEYLKYRGVDASHVKLVDGINPDTITPAAEGMARLSKTETSDDSSAAGGTSGGSSTATMK
jgi:hypothetical protein